LVCCYILFKFDQFIFFPTSCYGLGAIYDYNWKLFILNWNFRLYILNCTNEIRYNLTPANDLQLVYIFYRLALSLFSCQQVIQIDNRHQLSYDTLKKYKYHTYCFWFVLIVEFSIIGKYYLHRFKTLREQKRKLHL
jgi:hypothetical protein